MPRRVLPPLPALLAALAFAGPAAADLATFQQGVNGYAASRAVLISDYLLAAPGTFGDNGLTIADGASDWVFGDLASTLGARYAPLLRFDDLGLPVGSTVVAASLTLRLAALGPGARVIGRYLAAPWNANFSDPGGGTFGAPVGWRYRDKTTLAAWSALGALGDGTDLVAGKQFAIPAAGDLATVEQSYSVGLDPEVVQGWVDGVSPSPGVRLQVEAPDVAVAFVPPQRSGPVARRPLLTVIYLAPTAVGPPVIPAHDARLMPARPNPFASRTEIEFELARAGEVLLRVLDVQGRLVATLTQGHRDAGTHRATFDASGLPNGVYVCQLRAGGRVESRPLVRMK